MAGIPGQHTAGSEAGSARPGLEPAVARSARPGPAPAVAPTRILFVCLGNICRSPTAEGVMRALLAERDPPVAVAIDSAGTGSWHVGEPPDARASEAAAARGIPLSGHARQVRPRDFQDFDLIVAMDRSNREDLLRLAPDAGARSKVRMLRDFDPASRMQGARPSQLDVPDPYYEGPAGFELVLDIVVAACRGLLEEIGSAAIASGS